MSLVVIALMLFSMSANAEEPTEFVQKTQESLSLIDEQIKSSSEYDKVSKKMLAKLGRDKTVTCFVRFRDTRGNIDELAVKATGSLDLDQSIMSLIKSAAPFKLKMVEAQRMRFCPHFVMIDFKASEGDMRVASRTGTGKLFDEDCWIDDIEKR